MVGEAMCAVVEEGVLKAISATTDLWCVAGEMIGVVVVVVVGMVESRSSKFTKSRMTKAGGNSFRHQVAPTPALQCSLTVSSPRPVFFDN